MNQIDQKQLLHSLQNPGCYRHPVREINVLETHISWIVLTGNFAYKIKKAINLGFLDFSSIYKRHRYCDLELRLNRRTAADIYLDVVPISGTPSLPLVGDDEGEVIEYAVKMKQFPQQAQLDRLLDKESIKDEHIDALACFIADFHLNAEIVAVNSIFGDPQQVYKPVMENFKIIRDFSIDEKQSEILEQLEIWAADKYRNIQPVLSQRKEKGFIRECHGDLHLRNLAWINDNPIAFDCIEFNADLRWIDVLSDIAFLVMDLQNRNQHGYANRLLNKYLEKTGDYYGLKVLDFYLVYRALVRAKVDEIRLHQGNIESDEQLALSEEFSDYLRLAFTYVHRPQPRLILTHGPSASGKSTLTQQLLERIGAIRIRSDVERKRMFSGSKPGENNRMYSVETTDMTYRTLCNQAESILQSGYSVIVDATFHNYEHRELFRQLSLKCNASYSILDLNASPDTLRKRIVKRSGDVSDADLLVLESQLEHWEPLKKSEQRYSVSVNSNSRFSSSLVNEIIKTISI